MADISAPVQRGPPWIQLLMLMGFNTALYVANAFLEARAALIAGDERPPVREDVPRRHPPDRGAHDRCQPARRTLRLVGTSDAWWWWWWSAPTHPTAVQTVHTHHRGVQRRVLRLHAQFYKMRGRSIEACIFFLPRR